MQKAQNGFDHTRLRIKATWVEIMSWHARHKKFEPEAVPTISKFNPISTKAPHKKAS